ncbi:MAG TPA: D-2-hydroxyacid dehydrogenase [Clostridiaceae bacterium]|nr:D-2-hydroxyacid dehydrogenase [Clostridiaceae bacterium]
MKIVVLDGYTLNPGDLSWENLNKLGDVTIYEHTPFEMTVERAKGAEIVLTNKTPLGENELNQLPELKYIGVLATGYNVVDVETAKKKGIIVTNIPTYGTKSVAQMTFALLLEMTQHVQHHSDAVHNGEWTNCRDFCFWKYPLIELDGKTMGIIGFGRIGQAVADIASAFGMKVLGYDIYRSDQSNRKNFKWAELDELLSESDVVSLHCPLFPETKGIINAENLRKMKKTAFLINTARGQLVIDEDLADALNKGLIAGAALDVLSVEPPKADNPLLSAKNCIITPHISWATKEARARLMDIAVDNIVMFLKGSPVNVVNK